MRSSLALWFYGACAVLLAGLTLEWLPSGGVGKLPPPRVPHLAQADKGGDSKDTDEWAETITSRPLFAINRRPPSSKNGPRTNSGAGLPRLAGIMITPYGKHAIFMPEGGKALTLAEGASLDDNTIRHIAPDRVVLTGPKGQTVMLLTFDKQGIGSTTPNFVPPNFNPGFPRPGFPNMPGGPMSPGRFFPPQPQQQQGENGEGAPQPPQFPGFRGPNVPGGRE